jgi:hypothetical protein
MIVAGEGEFKPGRSLFPVPEARFNSLFPREEFVVLRIAESDSQAFDIM